MSRENKLKKLERRRQRGWQKPRDLPAEPSLPPGVVAISYNVSFDAMEDSAEHESMHVIDESEQSRLCQLLYDDPAQAIEPLRRVLDEHPGIPTLTQWLIAAYRSTGNDDEADRLAEQNYRNHPNYLFAKLDYAKMLLCQGKTELVDELFDRKGELSLHCPGRDTFHISEVMGFNGFMIEFLIRKGEARHARVYHKLLEQLAPDHPTTITCGKMLVEATFLQNLKTLSSRLLGRGLLPLR